MLSERLAPEDAGERIPATDEIINDAYSSIYELAMMMDYDSLEIIFDSLRGYDFDPDNAARLDRIRKCMDALDWEGVQNAAKEAL